MGAFEDRKNQYLVFIDDLGMFVRRHSSDRNPRTAVY